MCGGAERGQQPANTNYAAPDLREAYNTFRETGRVPYSHYGQGAPTNAGELERVRAAYPGAFAAPTNPAPAPSNPLEKLKQMLARFQMPRNMGR